MEPHYQRSSAIYKSDAHVCRPALRWSCSLPQFGRKLPIFWDEMQLIQGELPYCIDTTYLTDSLMLQVPVAFQLALRFQCVREHRWPYWLERKRWYSWEPSSPPLKLAILLETPSAKSPKPVMLRDTESPKAGCLLILPHLPPGRPDVYAEALALVDHTRGQTIKGITAGIGWMNSTTHRCKSVARPEVEMAGMGWGVFISGVYLRLHSHTVNQPQTRQNWKYTEKTTPGQSFSATVP